MPCTPCAVGRAASAPWPTDWPPTHRAHVGLGEVRPRIVLAPSYHVCARAAPLDAAPLDEAPVVGRLAVLPAEGAPGGCRWALGGNVAPRTAPAAEGVRSGPLTKQYLCAESNIFKQLYPARMGLAVAGSIRL